MSEKEEELISTDSQEIVDLGLPSSDLPLEIGIDEMPAIEMDLPEVEKDPLLEEPSEDDQSILKSSRELKSLLALSKTANLDTNISHKRKSVELHPKDAPSPELTKTLENEPPKKPKLSEKPPVTAENSVLSDATPAPPKEAPILPPLIEEEVLMREERTEIDSLTQEAKDKFCWRCHRDEVNISCKCCPRSYHEKCVKHLGERSQSWVCPECGDQTKGEGSRARAKDSRGLSTEQLNTLLKFALKRMVECNGSEPFLHDVDEQEFPDYRKHIVQPMTLTLLEKNIKANLYTSTHAFEADAKWILHNSIIFNSYQSKLTSFAKSIFKICRHEMSEIENCSSCYLNANTKKTWFVEVCPKPHVLIWAKLKGFPYWPAKAMCSNSAGVVDVRFFGAHDRAWVPSKECYLYSRRDPNTNKQKRSNIIECMREVEVYISNLKAVYGEFNYAPFKLQYDPNNELQQLLLFLPRYKPEAFQFPLKRKQYGRVVSTKAKVESVDNGGNVDDKKFECEEGDFASENSDQVSPSLELQNQEDDKEVKDDNQKSKNGRTKTKTVTPLKIKIDRKRKDTLKCDIIPPSTTDKINRVDIPENVELSILDNPPDGSLKNSSPEPERIITLPAQIGLDNSELSILPQSKSKISDKLMKKLSPKADDKKNMAELNDDNPEIKDEKTKEMLSKLNELYVRVKKSGNSQSPKNRSPKKVTPLKKIQEEAKTVQTEQTDSNSSEDQEIVLDRLQIDESNICDIIHSSLNSSEKSKRPLDDVEPKSAKKPKVDRPTASTSNPALASVKIIPVPSIVNKSSDVASSSATPSPTDSILKTKLSQSEESLGKKPLPFEYVEIKSEPDSSEEEKDETVYMEKKRSYMSALNISVRGEGTSAPKKKEIRTRSKTEEISKAKTTDSVTKVIDEVAKKGGSLCKPRAAAPECQENGAGEIFVKPFAKIPDQNSAPQTKARASTSKFGATSQQNQQTNRREANSAKKTAPTATVTKSADQQPQQQILTPPQPSTLQASNNVLILTPPGVLLPTSQQLALNGNSYFTLLSNTQNMALLPTSQVVMSPNIPTADNTQRSADLFSSNPHTTTQFQQSRPQTYVSQNDVEDPQQAMRRKGKAKQSNTEGTQTSSVAVVPTLSVPPNELPSLVPIINDSSAAPSTSGAAVPPSKTPTPSTTTEPNPDEYALLHSILPDCVSRSLYEMLNRPVPKLKPRPPGPLSQTFDKGVPSTAGPVSERINQISHRLTDYFRGMLIETLEDLGKSDDNNSEAKMVLLKNEIESLKNRHAAEVEQMRKNFAKVLKDVQSSLAQEKEKITEEARIACEVDTIKRIEDAKSRQWCALCRKEAQFYCCWNTSYCDYPCQQKHWPKHMPKCSQHADQINQAHQGNAIRPMPLALRNTGPMPAYNGRIVAKPTKVYVNRSANQKITPATFKVTPVPTTGHMTVFNATSNVEILANPAGPSSRLMPSTSLIAKLKSANSLTTTTSPSDTSRRTPVVNQTTTAISSREQPSTSNTSNLGSEEQELHSE